MFLGGYLLLVIDAARHRLGQSSISRLRCSGAQLEFQDLTSRLQTTFGLAHQHMRFYWNYETAEA